MKYKLLAGKQLFETTCTWCQEKYYAERETSRTCSSKCRQGAYRGRKLLAKWRQAGEMAGRREDTVTN